MLSKKLCLAALSCFHICLGIIHGAAAEPSNDATMKYEGVTKTEDFAREPCSIVLTADHEKFLALLPQMIDSGLLGNGMPRRKALTQPTMLEVTHIFGMAANVLHDDYDSYRNLDRCHVEGRAAVLEDGELEDRDLFSFDFDRSTFERVDWGHTEVRRLMRMSPHFRFGDWAVEKMTLEDEEK